MALKNESNWRVTDLVSSGQNTVTVHAHFKPLPMTCPKCGSRRRPRRYGNIQARYRDAPFLGRQVVIVADVQRFRCHACGQAFFQELTDMDGKRRMTIRCTNYIIDQAMARSSLRDVSIIVGVDEKTVRNVFDDRGLIFTVGDPPGNDRFVCECCLSILQTDELHLAPAKHFGRWRKGDLRPDLNVCQACFDFADDPWRPGMVRRVASIDHELHLAATLGVS